MDSIGGYINGFLERTHEGAYEGEISIEGISLSPIVGVFFKESGHNYLWLRRKDLLEYDEEECVFKQRKREPQWEAYLEKMMNGSVVEYKGEFPFMRLRFAIVGVWDTVLGRERQRWNFYIDRLPSDRQNLIVTNKSE